MLSDHRRNVAYKALDDADQDVLELHEGCCQPLRSPRMETLAGTLTDARTALGALDEMPGSAEAVIRILEDAGGQLGSLQVACCAPSRMPLYADALDKLTQVQQILTRVYRLEH